MFRRLGFLGGSSDKEPICQCRRHKRHGFNPWVRKIPWRRKWQLTPVLLPGESHGQRSLAATVHRIAQSWTRLTHAFRRFNDFKQVKHKDGQQTYHGKNAESQRQGGNRESSKRKMTYHLLTRKPQ